MFKIYVGNLDYKVKVEQLRELFTVYAPIEDLVIPIDDRTSRAKGFAIVMIRDAELGQAAVKAMQGKRLLGRMLVVNEAVKRRKTGQPVMTKADLVRNGPFGPRMYRTGDARSRTSRNPRRGQVGGVLSGTSAATQPLPNSPSIVSESLTTAPQQQTTTPVVPAATRPSRPTTTVAATPRPQPVVMRQVSGPTSVPLPKVSTSVSPTPAPGRPKAQRLATPKRLPVDLETDGSENAAPTPPRSPA